MPGPVPGKGRGVTGERWWFNIASGRVESDGDAGRRGDRMGPYPTREAAGRALESARLRTISWEASDADNPQRTSWTPPPPTPLSRGERWILAHRRLFRGIMLGAAAVLVVVSVLADTGSLGGLVVMQVFWGVFGVRMVERRAEELGQRP